MQGITNFIIACFATTNSLICVPSPTMLYSFQIPIDLKIYTFLLIMEKLVHVPFH